MRNRVYYIGIATNELPPSFIPNLERALDPLGDWIRFNVLTWFLSTNRSSSELREALQQVLKSNPSLINVLVVAIEPKQRFGYAPPWIWDWLDSQWQESPRTLAEIVREGLPANR
jgi:hypothetical protein